MSKELKPIMKEILIKHELYDDKKKARTNLYLIFVISAVSFITLTLPVYFKLDFIASESFLRTLSQVNATIFALAFIVPLAAIQLSKYKTRIELFSRYNLAYMITYLFTVFMPFLTSARSLIGVSFSLSLSVTCGLLLVPYLRHIKMNLEPEIALKNLRSKAEKEIAREERRIGEIGSEIHDTTMQAYALKDYSIFSKGLDELIALIKHAFHEKGGIVAIEVARWLQRTGENVIEDRNALLIFSERMLHLETRAPPAEKDASALPLRILEIVTLRFLVWVALEKKQKFNAIYPTSSIIQSAIINTYKNQKIRDFVNKEVLRSLISIPNDIVETAFELLRNKYLADPYLTALGELFPGLRGGMLNAALLKMLTDFEREYKSVRKARLK